MVNNSRLKHKHKLPQLYWNGQQLLGEVVGRQVAVLIPARLVSFRSEHFPVAPETSLRAAARLRAQRAFANLGPVAIDALLSTPVTGKVHILLMAVPKTVLQHIEQAAQLQNLIVKSICVDELQHPIPNGGLVVNQGEASLIRFEQDSVYAISILGKAASQQFDGLLQRERLRLGILDTALGGNIANNKHNFIHSSLDQKTSFMQHAGVRLAVLSAAIVLLLVAWLFVSANEIEAKREAALLELEQLRPLADSLALRREDMKQSASWFDKRYQITPMLLALAHSLPKLSDADHVYITRVRQIDGVQGIAEGVAADRGQLLKFIQRLRDDARIEQAELRSSRKQDKTSESVTFELIFVLRPDAELSLPIVGEKGVTDAAS